MDGQSEEFKENERIEEKLAISEIEKKNLSKFIGKFFFFFRIIKSSREIALEQEIHQSALTHLVNKNLKIKSNLLNCTH